MAPTASRRRGRTRHALRIASLTLLVVSAAASPQGDEDPTDEAPPNIVLIMADDLGYSDLGCYGGEIATPNLDRLAANGLRFTQFYTAGRCVPTRAALLTGLYAHQVALGGMLNDQKRRGYRGDLSERSVTLAEVLGEAGYATYMVGKWQVTNKLRAPRSKNWPLQRGFDRFYGTPSGVVHYFQPYLLARDHDLLNPTPDYYYTSALSTESLGYVEEHLRTQPERPFFLYLAHAAPHWPIHAPEEDVAACEGRYDAGWDALREKRRAGTVERGVGREEWALPPRDERVPAWDGDENRSWSARRMEVYAAMVERMDRGVGRLLELLEREQALENTLILFFSDNGASDEGVNRIAFGAQTTPDGRPIRVGDDPGVRPGPPDTYMGYGAGWAQVSNAPFRGYKASAYEGGVAGPLIAHWPAGFPAHGEIRRQVSHVVDVMATCLEVAGAEYPAERNGKAIPAPEGLSLVPAFHDAPLEREALYFETSGSRAVRAGDWKLVGRAGEPWELYDMARDRSETTDLAGDHPDRVTELATLWEAWAKRCLVFPEPGQPTNRRER